jgi:ABC-type lipoprotein export system ATPase subunit
VLDVNGVVKEYSTPRGPLRVLSDVTFSLSAGEAAAIMGPSGSGKSSLLYMLARWNRRRLEQIRGGGIRLY